MILKHRRGTTKEWREVDLIPEEGELVIEERKGNVVRCKVGDGVSRFSELPYIEDEISRTLLQEINRVKSELENETAAKITAAINGEKTLREAADLAINEKFGADYSKTNTIAMAIADAKKAGTDVATDLAALTGDSGRIKSAEKAIDALELVVNDTSKGNNQLRTDVNALQILTSDAAKGNVALYDEVISVAARVADIEKDYLKAADLFVLGCGSATTVTHIE